MCGQSLLFSEGWCSFLSRDKENDVSATPKPQKTRMGETPHVPPCGRALHRIRQSRIHKNAIAFLLNTRGSHIAKTLLSPPQRGRRKRRTTSGKRTQIPNKHIPSLIPSADDGDLLSAIHPVFFTLWNSKRSHLPKSFRPTRTKNAQSRGDLQGGPPLRTRFLWFVSLTRVKEMNNKPITVRNLCSHNFSFFKIRLLIRHAFGVPPSPTGEGIS